MKLKHFISFVVISAAAVIFINLADAGDVQYPVNELDNCQNETDCRSYCDKPENIEVCVSFAEKNNLMSAEEIQLAKNFIAAGAEGPGGCNGKDSCEQYCNDMSHIDECISFAEKNNLMPPEELAEAKQVQAAISRGIKPPPCGNKKSCDAYCEESDHMEECIIFGEAAGFIQGEELENAQKMLQAIKRGVKPPPCRGKEACDEYCSSPDNMELCINFAMEAGFMSEQEKADAQKMLQVIKKGIKPPNCKGKEECDIYCGQEEHFEECINFAEAAGFMSEKDVEMARKTGGKGPGGCRGEEECQSFCEDPANLDTCIDFAVQIGDMTQEEADQARQRLGEVEGMNRKMQECLTMPCAEAFVCFQGIQSGGEGGGQPPKEEKGAPEGMMSGINAEVQAKLEACAQEMQQQFQEGMMPEGIMPREGEMPIYDESRGGPAPFIPEGPSQEEINKMIEEETQRKMQQIMEEEQQRIMQEEIDRTMEEQRRMMEQPQSFFEAVKIFLAGLVPEI